MNTGKLVSKKMQDLIDRSKKDKSIIVLDEPESNVDHNKIATLDCDLIIKQATQIKTIVNNNEPINKFELINKFSYLYEKFPLIFQKAIDNENLTLLFSMIDKIKKIQKDKSVYDEEFEKVKTEAFTAFPPHK